jgi:hypothetical protein
MDFAVTPSPGVACAKQELQQRAKLRAYVVDNMEFH